MNLFNVFKRAGPVDAAVPSGSESTVMISKAAESGYPSGAGTLARKAERDRLVQNLDSAINETKRAPLSAKPLLVGLQAKAAERVKELGIAISLEGFQKTQHGIRYTGAPSGEALIGHGATTAEFISRWIQDSGVDLAEGVDVPRLQKAEATWREGWADLESHGWTRDHKQQLIDDDESKLGTSEFQGLGSSPHLVDSIILEGLRIRKARIKQIAMGATNELVAFGENLQAALEIALCKRLDIELKQATEWGLPFTPSILVTTIAHSLDLVEGQIVGLKKQGHHAFRDEFFGLPSKLMA